MRPLLIVLIVLLSLALLFFITCYVCFRITFYVSNKQKVVKDCSPFPGEIYKPHHPQMLSWMQELKTFKSEDIFVTSYDGLKLHAVYYEKYKGAPIEIMFPGYRGTAQRDLCGGVQRCFALGRNAITVDQRAQTASEGRVITFGIKERKDALAWANYAYNRFGKDVKLLLTGISMGATTALMASSLELPESVVGIIADCGFSDGKEIIKHVIKQKGLPPAIFYPLVRLGGKTFGKFDIEETSAQKELKNAKIPVMILHGDSDDFVPYYMAEINYNACASKKRLVKFEGAGHGLSYLSNPQKYLSALKEFDREIGIE